MSIAGLVGSVPPDLRHALRTLPRRPTFTLAAMVTLALGLGATTAIFLPLGHVHRAPRQPSCG